jgi:hypothetical protein
VVVRFAKVRCMAETFNPYVEWLGLPAHVAEPNHYQLLGLTEFETDDARIAIAADRAMSKVRSFRPGPNAKAWSKLLDELLLAKGRLLDPQRKSEYDADLREGGSSGGSTGGVRETIAKQEEPARSGNDSRFPPGMGPNEGRQVPLKQEELAAPKAAEPPMPVAPVPAPVAAPMAQPIAAAVWPDSMLHPAPHGPQPGHPGYGAPQAQGPYGQAPYGQAPYAQAPMAYPAAMPGYGMQPGPYGQPPMAQPAYGQPQYAQPQYQPAYPQQQPTPYGMSPAYGAGPYAPPAPPMEPPPAMPYGAPSAYAASFVAAPNVPLDPMAPVALPPALPGSAEDIRQGRVVGFAGAAAGTAAANIPTGSIPKGKAVTATAPALTSTFEPARSSFADASVPSPQLPPGMSTVAPADLVTRTEPTSTEKNILYGTIGAVVLLVGAIVFAIANSNRGPTDIADNPAPAPEPKPLARIEAPTDKPVSAKPATKPEKPAMPVQPAPVQPMPAVKPPMGDPFDDPPMPTPPVTPKPPVTVTDPPEPVKPEPMKPEPPKPEPAKPVPMPTPPKPPEPPPEVKLTPVELTTLSKAMTTARDALSERNFEEFEKQQGIANQLARSEDHKAKVSRLMMLGEYVKQFDRQLKSLLADENFDAGAELVIGKSTRVVVVERNPSMIVIRINGMNKTYSVANLPDGLALALMDKRLNESDPVRHVVKGAYFAAAKVQTDETRQKAKDLWEQATKEGVDVGDLALVLTDSYDFKE